MAESHHQGFITQGEQAGRFQPHDGHTRLGQGVQGLHEFAQALARGVDVTRGQVGAAAAQGPALQARGVHGIAASLQHGGGGLRVLGLEVAVEGVHEEHGGAAIPGLGGERGGDVGKRAGRGCAPEGVAPPAGPTAPG